MTLLASLNKSIPLGEETSNCNLCDRFWTNSANNLSIGVVTFASWHQISIALNNIEVYLGYLRQWIGNYKMKYSLYNVNH